MPRKSPAAPSALGKKRLTGQSLIEAISANPDTDRLALAATCGYAGKRGALTAFYQAIVKASGLATAHPRSAAYQQYLLQQGIGCTPIIEQGRIIGRRELRFSPRAYEQNWCHQTWQDRERRDDFDNMDAPFEVVTSYSSYTTSTLHYDFYCALASLDSDVDPKRMQAEYVNLLRRAYHHLGDDENGKTLDEFLAEYGEEPAELIALIMQEKAILRQARQPDPLEMAIQIALSAHAGMHDKAGAPYILHPLRVMQSIPFSHDRSVNKTHARMAAVLHDVIEDHGDLWPESRLRQQGIPEAVLAALDALTKRPKESKPAAARRAAANPIARLVKLADVTDNMNVWRIDPQHWDEKFRSRQAEYLEVREILESSFSRKK